MPRVPIDYQKGIIYRIVCDDVDVKECYVGSTTNLCKRKCEHIHDCRDNSKKAYKRKVYEFIRNNGGFLNWSVALVEEYACDSKLQLEQRERYWFEYYHAELNSKVPTKTI